MTHYPDNPIRLYTCIEAGKLIQPPVGAKMVAHLAKTGRLRVAAFYGNGKRLFSADDILALNAERAGR